MLVKELFLLFAQGYRRTQSKDWLTLNWDNVSERSIMYHNISADFFQWANTIKKKKLTESLRETCVSTDEVIFKLQYICVDISD